MGNMLSCLYYILIPSGVFTFNFEQILHIVLAFPLLDLKR